MDNPAKLTHIEGSIERPLTTDEKRVIPNWLGQAWRELNRVVPGITVRNQLALSDPDYLPADDIRDVVIAMVERKVRNPEGLRSWSGDDYRQEVDPAMSSGRIFVSADEIARLSPQFASGGLGLYSIPLSR